MKISVIGSRNFVDFVLLSKIINKEVDINEVSTVISGGAKGADSLGDKFAKNNNINVEIYKPNWSLGRHAGLLRNTTIIENSDVVFAFWDMKSKGTLDGIKKSIKFGKILKVVDTNTGGIVENIQTHI